MCSRLRPNTKIIESSKSLMVVYTVKQYKYIVNEKDIREKVICSLFNPFEFEVDKIYKAKKISDYDTMKNSVISDGFFHNFESRGAMDKFIFKLAVERLGAFKSCVAFIAHIPVGSKIAYGTIGYGYIGSGINTICSSHIKLIRKIDIDKYNLIKGY